MERADGKAAGDERALYLLEDRAGRWERAPTPYQTRRAVRVVTGPLHRDVASHRYSDSRLSPFTRPRFKKGCSWYVLEDKYNSLYDLHLPQKDNQLFEYSFHLFGNLQIPTAR
jgi:hypothetical protein